VYWLLANDKAESKPTSTEQDGSVRVDETEVLMAKTAADQTETKHQLPVNQRRPQGLVSLPSILIDVYFFVICNVVVNIQLITFYSMLQAVTFSEKNCLRMMQTLRSALMS